MSADGEFSHFELVLARGVNPKSIKAIARLQAAYRGKRVRNALRGIDRSYQTHYNHNVLEFIRIQEKFINSMQLDLTDLDAKLQLEFEKKPRRGSRIFGSSPVIGKKADLQSDIKDVKTVIAGVKAMVEVHTMLYNVVLAHYDSQWPFLHGIGGVLLSNLPLLVVYNTLVDTYQRVTNEPSPGLSRFLAVKSWSGNSVQELMQLAFKQIQELLAPVCWLTQAVIAYKYDAIDVLDVVRSYAILVQLHHFVSTSSICDWQSTIRIKEAESHISSIPSKVSYDFNPHRKYLKEGSLSIASEDRFVFLFTDCAYVVKRVKRTAFRFDYSINLTSLELPEDNSDTGFLLRTSERAYQVVASSPEEKISWYIAFQQVATTWRTGCFALPISTLTKRDKPTKPGVPNIVTRLCGYLSSFSNVATDMEVCTNGDAYAVEAMRLQIDRKSVENVSLLDHSGATIIGALKAWLVRLPVPLIPLEVTHQFDLFEDHLYTRANLSQFRRMMRSLPLAHLPVILRLLSFLEDTKIDTQLLGISWSFFLIRSERHNIDEALQIRRSSNILTAMLNNLDSLFKKPSSANTKKALPKALLQKGTSKSMLNEPVVKRGDTMQRIAPRRRSLSVEHDQLDAIHSQLPDLPHFSANPMPRKLRTHASRHLPPSAAPSVPTRTPSQTAEDLSDGSAVLLRKKRVKVHQKLRRSRSMVFDSQVVPGEYEMVPLPNRTSNSYVAQVTGDSDEEY